MDLAQPVVQGCGVIGHPPELIFEGCFEILKRFEFIGRPGFDADTIVQAGMAMPSIVKGQVKDREKIQQD
jgi:hypothetical protein